MALRHLKTGTFIMGVLLANFWMTTTPKFPLSLPTFAEIQVIVTFVLLALGVSAIDSARRRKLQPMRK